MEFRLEYLLVYKDQGQLLTSFLCCQQMAVLTNGCLPWKLPHRLMIVLTALMKTTQPTSLVVGSCLVMGGTLTELLTRLTLPLWKLTAKWGQTVDLLLVSIFSCNRCIWGKLSCILECEYCLIDQVKCLLEYFAFFLLLTSMMQSLLKRFCSSASF